MTEPAAPPPGVPSDARTWGMLCHLSALSCLLGIPFGWIVGPVVCWLIKRNEYPFVDDQGREAVNFQITLSIALAISIPLCFLLVGFVLIPAIAIVGLVFSIIGAVAASRGETYRYPFALRLVQ
jgi:hypothetical protein